MKGFSLKTYSVPFSLDRLVLGVDNIRYDVRLSPELCTATRTLVHRLIVRHTQTEKILQVGVTDSWIKEKNDFKKHCHDVILVAINKAKAEHEIQIDFLAQTALVKMLISEIQSQFKKFISTFKQSIRSYEMPHSQDLRVATKLKEELANIQRNRRSTIRNVGSETFQYLAEVQQKTLKERRESNFGVDSVLPDDVFSNPMLSAENPSDDFFMIKEYVLLGRRFEDPDKYNTLIHMIKDLINELNLQDLLPREQSENSAINSFGEEKKELIKPGNSHHKDINGWIKHVDNIDTLFNYFQSREQYRALKRQKGDREDILKIKKRMKDQRKILDFFYRKFKKAGLISRMVAFNEMKPIYLEYCPPLIPQQVLQYMISPRERKSIVNQLERLKGFYGKSFSMTPLQKKMKNLGKVKAKVKREYLVQFLKSFVRYHRDLQNFNMLKEAMDSINLSSAEKVINLSRINHTLYEFLLSYEQVVEEKPIINHVVIKADVRGSTEMTILMKEKKLNPASYFSMNFFDPITEILPEYGASKIFIEGDAIILSIFEQKDTPEGWYGVARACGMAINILFIVLQCNSKSKKHQLPIFELGIGISYHNSPPTFLFDSGNRIMISPAINLADRLSRSTKHLQRRIPKEERPFNLNVFQVAEEAGILMASGETYLRYNVNGIELNAAGFRKLTEEIDLKALECNIPEISRNKILIHTGKFPTMTGKYQRLIIREGQIPKISPKDLKMLGLTSRKYYEVCTHPKLYEFVKGQGLR